MKGRITRGAVACSWRFAFFMLRVSLHDMRGLAGWPPCHRVGALEYVGGDFAHDASGRKWRDLSLKRDRSPGQ
jgi:hypothetical protein